MEPTSLVSPPHNHRNKFFVIALVTTILLSNTLAGWFIAQKVYQWRTSDHYVSVKGLAEQRVKADLAVWDISYKITGDDLTQITTESLQNQKIITEFLIKNNFAANEIEPQRIEVTDLYTREYTAGKPPYRYIITSGVTLRTPEVDMVRQVSQTTAELVQQGIVLINKIDYLPNPRYFFTKLDEIRPKMLEQATKSARLVAEQFAANADCKLDSIRRASQGVFQILSIDSNAGQNYGSDAEQIGNINKIVRIVVSVDYLLQSNK